MQTFKFQCDTCKATAFFKAARRWIDKIEKGILVGVELLCPVCGTPLKVLVRNKQINITKNEK